MCIRARLGPKMIGAEETEMLGHALALWSNQAQIVRLCVQGGFDPKQAPAGLIDLVVRAGEAPDLKALEAEMKTTSKRIRQLFRKIMAA